MVNKSLNKLIKKKTFGKGKIKALTKVKRPMLVIDIPPKKETKIGSFFIR